MTVAFSVELQLGGIPQELAAQAARLGNLGGVNRQIGELLVESTRARFVSSTGPDGTTWTPLAESTIARYIAGFSKGFKKADGALNKRGIKRRDGRKPLIGETKALSTTIFYEVSADGNELAIGSPMEYAAVHQFGEKKGAAGATKHGHPIPFGDIPARPFVGLSTDDVAMMAEQYEAFIMEFVTPS